MNKRLINFVKKISGRPNLKNVAGNYEHSTGALKDFIDENRKQLLEKNHLPMREDRMPYNKAISEMEPAYNFFNGDLYDRNPKQKPVFEYDNFHSGTPLDYKPFPGSLREVKKVLRRKNLFWYPRSAGGFYSQQKIVDYLIKEGFEPDGRALDDGSVYGGIGIENIVFTCSTTHAYSLIMAAIAQPNDVILMSAPNYGLFAIMTELDDYRTEVLELKEEDGWQVNPEALASRIDEINKDLSKEGKGKERAPKVVAFLNINPHNPTGKVLNRKNQEILEGIGQVCKERGVFVIDDLVYRDLSYDMSDPALPLATMPQYFDNTISIFGLSKAYGLASFRAGFIVAPVAVAEVVAQRIHDTMDSMPVLQVGAVTGAFNASKRREREFKKYISHILAEYQFRYRLIRAMVYGLSSVKDPVLKRKIKHVIDRYASKGSREMAYKGVSGLKIRAGTEPESGFFTIFDFTEFKGKVTADGKTIENENDMLEFFFTHGGVTYLMGGNIFWPNKDEFVGRISFGISRKAIVQNMVKMGLAVRELK